jgi:hypothetical protein
MASTKHSPNKLIADLPLWIAATVERNESFRFEALKYLEQATTKLAEIEAKPPADSSSVAVAVLFPMHLAVKALLAAKGYRATSTRSTLELLRLLYEGDLPESRTQSYVGVQSLRIQGPKAIEAARALLDFSKQLLSKAA